MELLSLIILVLYVLLIIRYAFGWSEIKIRSENRSILKVSVVIPMRNESSQVARLLRNLESLIYPKDKLEFILVNDHSSDNTLDLLEEYRIDNLQILNMGEGKFGKKKAVMMAVSIASGDIILASDADCYFNQNWVQSMVSYFENDEIKLVSGPVAFKKRNGILHRLQELEFLSLIGSGAGAIGIENPIFCNGANMAYRKDVFLETNNFNNDNTVSGDDVFLLHSIKAKYPNSISFAKDENAIVLTHGVEDLKGFVNQRKRWVAKSTKYKDLSSVFVSYLVFFTNLTFISLFVLSFFNNTFLNFFIVFYIVKYIADLFLLLPVLNFFKRIDLTKWIFPFELIYSFYIVLVVILSFAKSFEWKGRIHRQ